MSSCPRSRVRSEQGAVVLLFQAADLFLDGLQVHGHFVQGLQAVLEGFLVLQVRQGRVNFHHLKGDGLGGITDLLNGIGTGHGAYFGQWRRGSQQRELSGLAEAYKQEPWI